MVKLGIVDNGGRRLGLDRRAFSYAIHLPERRSNKDRRNNVDRRNGTERKSFRQSTYDRRSTFHSFI